VTIVKPNPLPNGECIEVTEVTVGQACPAQTGVPRAVGFVVNAQTTRSNLSWRRSPSSSDVITPPTGAVASQGETEVQVQDIVLDSTVTFEVLDGSGLVLLAFTLRNY
jgi:hypothetical protein